VKHWLLPAAIAAGVSLPQLHHLSAALRWLLMCVLFLGFLHLPWRHLRLEKSHVQLIVLHLLFSAVVYALFWLLIPNWSLGVLMLVLAPVAVASPAVVRLMGGRQDWMVVAVLLSNLMVALIAGTLLPLIAGTYFEIPLGDVLGSVMFTLGAPLVLALMVRRIAPNLPGKIPDALSMWVWALAIFLVCSRASHWVLSTGKSLGDVVVAFGIAAFLGIIQFALGERWIRPARLGKVKQAQHKPSIDANGVAGRWPLHSLLYGVNPEGAHAFGQKNTVFMIWICLTWLDPGTALIPVSYVIWQNLFIAFRFRIRARIPLSERV